MKMTMIQQLTMYLTITSTIRTAYPNLTEKEIADLGENITKALTKNLDIEIKVTAEDENLMVGSLLMALADVMQQEVGSNPRSK